MKKELLSNPPCYTPMIMIVGQTSFPLDIQSFVFRARINKVCLASCQLLEFISPIPGSLMILRKRQESRGKAPYKRNKRELPVLSGDIPFHRLFHQAPDFSMLRLW